MDSGSFIEQSKYSQQSEEFYDEELKQSPRKRIVQYKDTRPIYATAKFWGTVRVVLILLGGIIIVVITKSSGAGTIDHFQDVLPELSTGLPSIDEAAGTNPPNLNPENPINQSNLPQEIRGYHRPSAEECDAVSNGEIMMAHQDKQLLHSFKVSIDLALVQNADPETVVEELEDKMETILMPIIIGCSTATIRRKMLSNETKMKHRRQLILSKYSIAGAQVTVEMGPKDCATNDYPNCIAVAASIDLFLKGPENDDDLKDMLSSVFGPEEGLVEVLEMSNSLLGLMMQSVVSEGEPTMQPSAQPTVSATVKVASTIHTSPAPSTVPSSTQSAVPSSAPSPNPSTEEPTRRPSREPTKMPTLKPSQVPTTLKPSFAPSISPTNMASSGPTISPTKKPTSSPSKMPTTSPSVSPTPYPTPLPTPKPSLAPTPTPSTNPTRAPTKRPTVTPSAFPSMAPSERPSTSSSPTITPPLRVACAGDSMTRGRSGGVARYHTYPVQLRWLLGEGFEVLNFGRNAATALRGLSLSYVDKIEFQNSLDFEPDIYLLMLGTNDSRFWAQYGQNYREDMKWIVNKVRSISPASPARIIIAIPPWVKDDIYDGIEDEVLVNSVQPEIRALAKQGKLQLVDMYNVTYNQENMFTYDGLHLNHEGYQVLAEVWNQAIKCNPNGICEVGEDSITCPTDCS